MSEHVKMSGEITELAKALASAQMMIKPVEKNAVNPHFKSKYADLTAVVDACKEALATKGVSVLQMPGAEGSVALVTTMLLHTSGQWISGTIRLRARDESPQALGSAITYAKRYSLAAMLNIAADEDDDGNEAQPYKPTTASYTPTTEKSQPATRPAVGTGAPGDYVVTFGKFKGQRLMDVAATDLRSYAKYLQDAAGKDSKPLSPSASEFIQQVNALTNAPAPAPPVTFFAPPPSDEDVPF